MLAVSVESDTSNGYSLAIRRLVFSGRRPDISCSDVAIVAFDKIFNYRQLPMMTRCLIVNEDNIANLDDFFVRTARGLMVFTQSS